MPTKIHIHPNWINKIKAASLDSFAAMSQRQGKMISSGTASRVVEIPANAEVGLPALVLKQYLFTSFTRLGTLFGTPKVQREFENLAALETLGYQAASPVAYGFQKSWGLIQKCFFLSVKVPDAQSLREISQEIHAGHKPFPMDFRIERIAQSLGRVFASLHERKIFLHSPFFKNILWKEEKREKGFYFIDLPWAGLWRYKFFPRKGRVRDLACLEKGAQNLLPAKTRLRFLKTYASKEKIDRGFARDVREVAQKIGSRGFFAQALKEWKYWFQSGDAKPLVYHLRHVLVSLPLIYCFFSTRWEWENELGIWTLALGFNLLGNALRVWAYVFCPVKIGREMPFCREGPYKLFRAPVYVSYLLVLAGLTIASELVWFLPVVLLWAFAVYSIAIRYEEQRLLSEYGDKFFAYKKQVPRWIPAQIFLASRAVFCPQKGVVSPKIIYAHLANLMLLLPFLIKELNFYRLWE